MEKNPGELVGAGRRCGTKRRGGDEMHELTSLAGLVGTHRFNITASAELGSSGDLCCGCSPPPSPQQPVQHGFDALGRPFFAFQTNDGTCRMVYQRFCSDGTAWRACANRRDPSWAADLQPADPTIEAAIVKLLVEGWCRYQRNGKTVGLRLSCDVADSTGKTTPGEAVR